MVLRSIFRLLSARPKTRFARTRKILIGEHQRASLIPADATDVYLKIEEMYVPFPEKWSTVYSTNFPNAVDKSYEISGTTLNAKCKEL